MNTEDGPAGAKEAWQAQPVNIPRISIGFLQQRVIATQRTVRNRLIFEFAGLSLFIAFVFWFVSTRPFLLVNAGLGVTLIATIYDVLQWRRKTFVRHEAQGRNTMGTIFYLRQELVRQRDVRRGCWELGVAPLLPGILILFVGIVAETPTPPSRVLLSMLIAIIGTAAVVWHQERSADEFQREIDALDGLTSQTPD